MGRGAGGGINTLYEILGVSFWITGMGAAFVNRRKGKDDLRVGLN